MTPTCKPAVIDLPIGSNCAFGFVFRDANDDTLDLAGSEFILTMKHAALLGQFDTAIDTTVLYIQEDANIEPIGGTPYVADRLVFVLTPDISRRVPPGALTTWEIERRLGDDQRNWGSGLFRGYGGVNPDD